MSSLRKVNWILQNYLVVNYYMLYKAVIRCGKENFIPYPVDFQFPLMRLSIKQVFYGVNIIKDEYKYFNRKLLTQ